ncbi:hypothetical protein [Candidatus Mycoplasma haematominutum]|uniref:Uncharacterized protein n=1 Tax=Candidatus Mycoplasma haematominutum 'Birmingham 1' TaxID=1116213 RepID=G8C3S6_9MOLU|nr:hypothetical protein [Candidatus Mycoplasma haematominutum]CCE66974.1 hypothetical protein MHM_04560 [Candidatus Mycoplasma haematominutum 'Birmingham 1']
MQQLWPGGGAITGTVYGVVSNYSSISSGLHSVFSPIVSAFTPNSSSAGSQGQLNLFGWFNPALQSIRGFFSSVFSYLSSWVTSTISFFGEWNTSYSKLSTWIEGLKTSVFVKQQLIELFSDFHRKIPKVASFFLDSSSRERFQKLFTGDNASKNLEAFKVLSGSKAEIAKYFKVDQGILTHLVNKFAEEPTKVIEKIERLTKLISSISEKYSSSSSGGESVDNGAAPSAPYEFNIQRLDKFLQQRSEGAQIVYELGLQAEVGLNSVGVKLPQEASTVTSLFSSVFGMLLNSSSSTST